MFNCCKPHPHLPPADCRVPSVPPPGSSSGDPHAVGCILPGGKLVTLPVPNLSAADVRTALAAKLSVPVNALAEFSLLWEDVNGTKLQVWDEERVSLPADQFFVWGHGRPNFDGWTGRRRRVTTRRPFVHLRRLRSPAHAQHDVPDAIAMLDTEQVIADLKGGEYPPALLHGDGSSSDSGLPEVAVHALLVGCGPHDAALHTRRFLSSTLPQLLPSSSHVLRGRHAALLRRHAELSADLRRDLRTTTGAAASKSGPGKLLFRHPLEADEDGARMPARIARTALLSCVRRSLPSLTMPAQFGVRVDLSECLLFGGLKLQSAGSSWEFVLAIGPSGLVLLWHATPPSPKPLRRVLGCCSSPLVEVEEEESATQPLLPAADYSAASALIPWPDLLKWQCSSASVDLVISSECASAAALRAAFSAGSRVRLWTAKAPLIGCALQVQSLDHAPPASPRSPRVETIDFRL